MSGEISYLQHSLSFQWCIRVDACSVCETLHSSRISDRGGELLLVALP
jgi:hypothetical protein